MLHQQEYLPSSVDVTLVREVLTFNKEDIYQLANHYLQGYNLHENCGLFHHAENTLGCHQHFLFDLKYRNLSLNSTNRIQAKKSSSKLSLDIYCFQETTHLCKTEPSTTSEFRQLWPGINSYSDINWYFWCHCDTSPSTTKFWHSNIDTLWWCRGLTCIVVGG